MTLSEIVLQLKAVLPRVTTLFTTTLAMSSATHASNVATVNTTAAHGLSVGNAVSFTGIRTVVPIDTVSVDVPTLVAEITTTIDHDLTTGWEGNPTVTLQGAGNAWDATWPFIDSVNRRKFRIQLDADLSAVSTVGLESTGIANIYNTLAGSFTVASVPSTTSFTVALVTGDLGTFDITDGNLEANPRVTGVAEEDVAFDSYSTDSVAGAEPWVYVLLGDATVSRSRQTNLDSVSTEQLGQDWRQWLIQPFSVLVAQGTANQETALAAVDSIAGIRAAILRGVLGKRFSTGLSIGQGEMTQFVRDGLARYDRAVHWHGFDFEAISQLSYEDTVGVPDNVAFRDINITQTIDIGQDLSDAGSMSDTIDLDDEPVGP